ncbi:MAG: hypothetical protein ACLFPQ_06235 [Candidatus Woesearchaeota archaeon]
MRLFYIFVFLVLLSSSVFGACYNKQEKLYDFGISYMICEPQEIASGCYTITDHMTRAVSQPEMIEPYQCMTWHDARNSMFGFSYGVITCCDK